MRKFFTFIFIGSTLPLLQGCIPAAVVGGTASLGTTLAEERRMGEVFSDTEITATINAKWLDHDPEITKQVGLQVRQGRVLLTGLVDTQMRQIDAVRLAWEADGVKEVIDETRIGDNSVGRYAQDAWITTKLNTEMLFNQDVSSINYNVKTVDGVVYLLGIAQNQQELDRVMNIARGVSGVKNVVSYVKMKDGSSSYTSGNYQQQQGAGMVREEAPIMMQPTSDNYGGGGGGFPAPRAM